MGITDELREWKREHHVLMGGIREFDKMLDRIDAEADDNERFRREAEPFCNRLREAAAERADVTLFGVDYVALPLDADGVPIRVGDVMEWPTTGETFEVVGIGDGTLFYVDDGCECADWTGASTKHHHHAPTVEDVLREFADEVQRCCDTQDTIAEYAARLRLAEEVGA